MLKEDFAIQSDVKRMLVRSNIDYSDITCGSLNRVVYFRGFFRLRTTHIHEDADLNQYLRTQEYITKTLFSLEKKIKSITGVKDVAFQFLNWEKTKGRWVRIEEGKGKEEPLRERHTSL